MMASTFYPQWLPGYGILHTQKALHFADDLLGFILDLMSTELKLAWIWDFAYPEGSALH